MDGENRLKDQRGNRQSGEAPLAAYRYEYAERLFGDGSPDTDTVWLLECNVDDCGGETMGYVMELLFVRGAKDAWFSPIFMKKNRPAYTLHVICGEEAREELEHIIFSGTTTIGIRRVRMERTVLKRSFMEVETSLGTGTVKLCCHRNRIYAYPEFESVKRICQSSGQDYQTAYHLLKEAAMRQIEKEGAPAAESRRQEKTV